jgi:hypothetical protein
MRAALICRLSSRRKKALVIEGFLFMLDLEVIAYTTQGIPC